MSKYDFQTYRLKILVLTPLHIGNGREMLHEYDYAIHASQTWRINENALLDMQNVEDPKVMDVLTRTKPAQLLKPQDFTPGSPLFRYILKGTPKSAAEGAVIREQIKDAFDRPYLPGTTVKGALRTALAGFLWERDKMHPDISKLKDSAKFVAKIYEQKFFGKDPNHDLLRALQIADSSPLAIDSLMLINVRVLTGGGKPGSPIEVEAIRRETEIDCQLKLDTVLFSNWAKEQQLDLPNSDALIHFIEIARQHSQAALQRELTWARKLRNGKHIVSHYDTMLKHTLQPNQFFLQLGWGGGWQEKTFGELLKRDEYFMRIILKPRKQEGYDVARGHIPKNIQDFPVSRRIAMASQRSEAGSNDREIPALPLGWVLVTVETDQGLPINSTNDQNQKIFISPPPTPEIKPAASPKPKAKPAPLAQPNVKQAYSIKPKAEPAPQPPEKPLIKEFSATPDVGDRFRGTVFSDYKGEIWLEIPGLDPDTQAYAVLLRSDNPLLGKVREGQDLQCVVVSVQKESPHYWRVICRVEAGR